jgi:hypothetical protein
MVTKMRRVKKCDQWPEKEDCDCSMIVNDYRDRDRRSVYGQLLDGQMKCRRGVTHGPWIFTKPI